MSCGFSAQMGMATSKCITPLMLCLSFSLYNSAQLSIFSYPSVINLKLRLGEI